MISSCPNYLHADVSDGEDLSHHQQEVTDGQFVTMSLVHGTVDSNVTLECHLCYLPPLSGARQAEGLHACHSHYARIHTDSVKLGFLDFFWFSRSVPG